ncbi:MAG: glycosyltransferase family 1 protein [Bacteroidales bacterium]
MKIVVNARVLIKNKLDGIGWFTFETLKRITSICSADKFYFLFDRNFSDEFIFSDNIEPIIVRPPTRHPILWYYWFEHKLPLIIKKIKPDLFVSPDGYLSLTSNTPSVAVIHDINFIHFPHDFPLSSKLFYNHYFPLYAKKASRIATVSEFSKNDIADNFHIAKDKIDVVYNGFNQIYSPIGEETKTINRKKYSAGSPYFIFVGSVHPRKNVANMLIAFDNFRQLTVNNVKLIIAGELMFKTGDIAAALKKMKFKNDVIFTGRMEPLQLKELIGSAIALLLVSKLEGFGIPVIEAYQCQTPVIVSNLSALPEIASDGALYVNPFSVESISLAMCEMYNNNSKRQQLAENGYRIAQKYSWDNTAGLFLKCILKVIDPE